MKQILKKATRIFPFRFSGFTFNIGPLGINFDGFPT